MPFTFHHIIRPVCRPVCCDVIAAHAPLRLFAALSPLRLLAALSPLLLLAACSSETEPAPAISAPTPITLGIYAAQPTPSLTRADSSVMAYKTIPTDASIGVYAYYHNNGEWNPASTPNFMFNQRAQNTGTYSHLIYSPLKYWPNETADHLSFIAYYPYISETPESDEAPDSPVKNKLTPLLNNDDEGLPTFFFSVNDDVKKQIDFLISDFVPNQSKTNTAVRLLLRHATSKIEFRIVVDDDIQDDVAYFTLHSLCLTNIYKEGTYTPVYDAETETTTLQCLHNDKRKDTYNCTTTEAYLLLPQVIAADALLKVNYDLAFKSKGTTGTYNSTTGQLEPEDAYVYSNANAQVQLNTLTPEWLPSHHYIYTIRLRATRIDFTAQVSPWGEYNWQPM